MSLKTWKKEYYPVKPSKKMTTIDAIEHSIRKWQGLSPTALDKHECSLYNHILYDDEDAMNVNDKSCALCIKFLDHSMSTLEPCKKCPLAIVRGGIPCDEIKSLERDAPYQMGVLDNDNKPMLRWLRKALKMVKEGTA